MELKTFSYRVGQPVDVTLVLSAGSRGVYVPNYFADFMATCQTGFSVSVLTDAGALADPKAPGCAASIPHSPNDTALSEFHNFVYLKPGEWRAWRTTLSTSDIPPGEYRLLGEYLSAAYKMDEVGRLPAVMGLMAIGRIQSKPAMVRIVP